MSDQNDQPFNDSSFWQEQYDQASAGSNTFLFFKAERTRVRLVGVGQDPREWFRKVESEYRGQVSPKFLVKGYELSPDEDKKEPILQAIVFTKGTWATLSNLMVEGYNLFGPNGLGVTVVRSNVNNRISYDVMASPKPVPLDEKMAAEAAKTPWQYYLDEFQKMQENRQSGNSGQGLPVSSLADQLVNSSPPASPGNW